MTRFEVQFELPVDNPVNKVRMKRGKNTTTFFVPLNHPEAHKMGFQDLIAAAELSGLLDLPTPLNKNRDCTEKISSIRHPK